MNVFDDLYHPPELDHLPLRLVSKAVNESGDPVVEINPGDAGILILKFVRKSSHVTFNKLLNDFLCYAKNHGFEKVELEDDAMFVNGTCRYRSLLYRAFKNENSIYVKRGFRPTVDVELWKTQLYNYLIRDAKNMAHYFKHAIECQIMAIPTDSDTDRFGEWVTTQTCIVIRDILNTLDLLRHLVSRMPDLNENSVTFLEAFTFYYMAHQNLYMNVF